MATNAHCVEVEVGADARRACERTPLRGRRRYAAGRRPIYNKPNVLLIQVYDYFSSCSNDDDQLLTYLGSR
jgi:hypothetical protein